MVIVISLMPDQPDEAPLLSIALAVTKYVRGRLQVWDSLTTVPEPEKPVSEVLPSPQLKIYFTVSPSASVDDV